MALAPFAMTVLYGSQSGCAQDVAERIARHARLWQVPVTLSCMDDFGMERLEKIMADHYHVFVASTTGQGVAPDNMSRLWRSLLSKRLPSNHLEHMRFAVFGLGDSSYPIYNAVARRLFQRLLDLGAVAFYPRGLGDDQHDLGYDGDFMPWMDGMWRRLRELHPSLDAMRLDELAPRELVDVRIVELSARHVRYTPGDILIIHPRNSVEAARQFIVDRIRMDPLTVVVIECKDDDGKLPTGCKVTILDLFVRFLDIFGTPRRHFFEFLAQFATDDVEKERLLELSSPEGQADLLAYNFRERRTYAEVLNDFPSAQVPLARLLEEVPRLAPRQFSIASSPRAHPDRIQILAAIVEFQTPYKRRRVGLCSHFLRTLKVGDSVDVWSRSGCLSIPPSPVPMIMVGPGTGIAPFRSMCNELSFLHDRGPSEIRVYFGCRYKANDFYFEFEWDQLLSRGTITAFVPAFSRDQPNKVYVQDQLREQGADVWRILSGGGVFYLAGSSNSMPKQVQDAIIDICIEYGHMTDDDARTFVRQLQRRGQYVIETW
ncbi:unnamed protein product (mitochondrion) [Plasmodiophora brassicae]|uniref:NADPH-dependent FMN and FAD-containing oxidoreductase n=1 Tax=Plasmodiophora brassicae TaxID=37360 RepID=A0A3P3Y1S4_PLABS|nr:unnamed protein product [Plasmodiophora brassicae]